MLIHDLAEEMELMDCDLGGDRSHAVIVPLAAARPQQKHGEACLLFPYMEDIPVLSAALQDPRRFILLHSRLWGSCFVAGVV